jgi:ArsR family transcriptional regulator, arsenate/arsenite/antimonite-responsive transcriptional repressor
MNKAIEDTVEISFRENIPLLMALGDPVRQDIIMILIEHGSKNVSEITSMTNTSRPAISHHLKVLKDAKVVSMIKEGKHNLYYLNAKESLQKLKELIETVERKCEEEMA